MTAVELVEGRALAIKFKWHGNDEIVLINTYAPNNKNEHQAFWEKIDEKRRSKGLRRPDFMLGDFNLTEDPIDRLPAHHDNTAAIAALRNLRQCLDLQDTWRHAFPHERCFTFRAKNNGQQIKSWIDRIYTSCEAAKTTLEWDIHQTSVPTDHWLVSVRYAPTHAPYIGKGRTAIHASEVKNNELTDPIIERGKTLQSDMIRLVRDNVPREVENPQTLWHDFKSDTGKIAKKHCNESRGKRTKKINAIEHARKNLANNPELDSDDE
ncbi:Endonuclease/exonuclease/phosphatase, partial [Lactarius sanguifluus]